MAMADDGVAATAPTRLSRIEEFLRVDPDNVALLADAAQAAFDEGAPGECAALLERHARIAPLPGPLRNLEAIAAIAGKDYPRAIAALRALIADGADAPPLRFNLAWALAMTGAHAEALECLDDAAVAVSPRGPMLKIQMLHHLDRYDEGLAEGVRLAERHPHDELLMGALATLAMDAGDIELCRRYAALAPNDPQGATARGMLGLEGDDVAGSIALFDAALARQPENPRAWVGKGLGLLSLGDARAATTAIDRGAGLFETHLGSWIASGWAHFIAGDADAARDSFVRARGIDANFAESHGGIAVLDVLAGDRPAAERNAEIALRLDRQCLGGVLAKTLLLEESGDAGAAQRLRDRALSGKIGTTGQSLAQLMMRFSAGPGRR